MLVKLRGCSCTSSGGVWGGVGVGVCSGAGSPKYCDCPYGLSRAHRQQDLYRILKAYTIYRPDEGYCQAQAPVAAVLLMHMPAEVSRRRT